MEINVIAMHILSIELTIEHLPTAMIDMNMQTN